MAKGAYEKLYGHADQAGVDSITVKLVAVQVGDKANCVAAQDLTSLWNIKAGAVQQLQGSATVQCYGSPNAREVVISGVIHVGSVATGPLGQCPVYATATVQAGMPQITVAHATSWWDGTAVAVLVFTVQVDAVPSYAEPPKERRQDVWDEHSIWKKKWTRSSINSTDLSQVPDHELGHFYKYHLDKRWERGCKTGFKLLVGVGVGVAASFFDPTGIILVITITGAVYHVVTGAGQQYRTQCKAWHILDESRRRGLQLMYDPPSGSWYTAKAAKAFEVTAILEAIATVASAGVIQ